MARIWCLLFFTKKFFPYLLISYFIYLCYVSSLRYFVKNEKQIVPRMLTFNFTEKENFRNTIINQSWYLWKLVNGKDKPPYTNLYPRFKSLKVNFGPTQTGLQCYDVCSIFLP